MIILKIEPRKNCNINKKNVMIIITIEYKPSKVINKKSKILLFDVFVAFWST